MTYKTSNLIHMSHRHENHGILTNASCNDGPKVIASNYNNNFIKLFRLYLIYLRT